MTAAAVVFATLSCAEGHRAAPKPPPRVEEPVAGNSERPLGWPYWDAVPVSHAASRAMPRAPLPVTSFEKIGGAEEAWKELSPSEKDDLSTQGFTRVTPKTRVFGVGSFYQRLVCDRVPALVTVDALFAIALRAIGVALREAEARVSSRALHTLVSRLDARLTDEEPRAHPDLTAGLQVAEGVVSLAMSLLDHGYAVPPEVATTVHAELTLLHAHAGVATSPILHIPIDYAVFAPRGAAREESATFGSYLASQWLAAAVFAFDGEGNGGRDDVSSARARTRGALLIARLLTTGSDADAEARQALHEMDQLDALAFGEPAGTSPTALASLVLARGFDLQDATAIEDPVALDRVRRAADKAVGAMEVLPLRSAPETALWDRPGDVGHETRAPRSLDVATWLAPSVAPGQRGQPFSGHGSCYASALDAIATWLSPSSGDVATPGTASRLWAREKVERALSAWVSLRHESLPYARSEVRTASSMDPMSTCPVETARVLVEPQPEAIAALLGLVRQVDHGLTSIHAIDATLSSADVLAQVESLLDLARRGAEEGAAPSALFASASTDLEPLLGLLAAVEAGTTPAAGPFAVVVYSNAASGQALEEGTTGLDSLYVVVTDPRTRRRTLAVGPAVSHAAAWVRASDAATDLDWAARLASANPPVGEPFAGIVAPP